VSIYFPAYLILAAGVMTAFVAGDLFNLYVAFEILLVASYVLITLGGSGPRIRAGTTYVVVSLVSSMLFLLAIAGVYAATGTVNLADLSERLADVPPSVRLALQLMLLCAFAVKAAVFPLAAWLPDSYPSAPAPVTAVFAGLLTKVGVYAIIRTQTLLFPDSPLSSLLLWAALLTMLVGILGAIVQSDLKRMLSFTLVSHVGYLLLGVALASGLGLAGTIFYVVHHLTIPTTLFLVAGLVELRSGTSHLGQLGGLAKTAPILALMFFIPAMNLAGIPPFSGFLGKVALIQASSQLATPLAYVLVAGAVLTSLLTLYAVAKAWNRAFWQPLTTDADTADTRVEAAEGAMATGWTDRATAAGSTVLARQPAPPGTASGGAWREVPDLADRVRLPFGMTLPTLALVMVGLALTVFAGPLFALSERAATELRDPASYRTAVFEAPTEHVIDDAAGSAPVVVIRLPATDLARS
jgi:multicomponent Na+:H+ antiporter subunit D